MLTARRIPSPPHPHRPHPILRRLGLLGVLLGLWALAAPTAAQTDDPSKFGINSAIFYPAGEGDTAAAALHGEALDRARDLGMGWYLSIQRFGWNGIAVAQNLQATLSRCMNPVIRTCTGTCPWNCDDTGQNCTPPTAEQLAGHLAGVVGIATSIDLSHCDPVPRVHIIAGPNEPDKEFWLPGLESIPTDRQLNPEEIDQVALANAAYMGDLLTTLEDSLGDLRSRVVLLSPAFDCVNQATVPALIQGMIDHEAPFGDLDGMALNTYNDLSGDIGEHLTRCLGYFQGTSAPLDYIVITETGMIEIRTEVPADPATPCPDDDEQPADCVDNDRRPAALSDLRTELQALCGDPRIQGVLFFNSLGANPDRDFNYNRIDDLTVSEGEAPRVNTAEWDYLLGGTGVGAPAAKCCDLATDDFCDLPDATDECPMTLPGGYCGSDAQLGFEQYSLHCSTDGAFYAPFDSAFDFAVAWRPLGPSNALSTVEDALGSNTAFVDRALRIRLTGDTGASQSYVSRFIAAEDGATLEISGGMRTSNADKPAIFVDLFDSQGQFLKTVKTLRGTAGDGGWKQLSARARMAAGGRNAVGFARVRIQAGDVYRLGSGDTATTWFDNINLNLNHLPEADIAVAAPRILLPGDVVVLDGSGSSDPEGRPLSFSWGVIENRQLEVEIEDPAAPQTQLTVPATKQDVEIVVGLKVSDGELKSPTATAVIGVTGANSPPSLTRTAELADVAIANHTYDTTVTASDPDDDPLTFGVQGPAGMSIDPASGEILWAADNGDLGSHLVTVTASDGEAGDSFSYTVRVFQGEDFGDVPVGGTARGINVFLNSGGGILTVSSVSIVSGDVDQFRIARDECTGAQLPGGDPTATCEIEWEFAPTSEGFKSALFQLTGNAPTFTGALAGDGVPSSFGSSSPPASECSGAHLIELAVP